MTLSSRGMSCTNGVAYQAYCAQANAVSHKATKCRCRGLLHCVSHETYGRLCQVLHMSYLQCSCKTLVCCDGWLLRLGLQVPRCCVHHIRKEVSLVQYCCQLTLCMHADNMYASCISSHHPATSKLHGQLAGASNSIERIHAVQARSEG